MLRIMGVTLLGLAMGVDVVVGQQGEPIAPGERVRVTSAAQRINKQVGTVIAADSATIMLEVRASGPMAHRWIETTDTVVVSREAADHLEVSRGSGSRAGTGALIGGLSGALLGAIVAAGTYQDCTPQPGNLGLDCLGHDLSAGSSAGEAGGQGGRWSGDSSEASWAR